MNEIFIYQSIGSYGLSNIDFTSKLNQFKNKDVSVRINSPGGDVFDGFAMYNAIKNHGRCDIYIDGVAASITSVIVLAGRKIYAAKNAMIMIHNPSSGNGGDSKQLKKDAEVLDKIKSLLVDSYHERTKIPKQELVTMLDNETWFTAQEALEKGFIDDITDNVFENSTAINITAKSADKLFLSYVKKTQTTPDNVSLFSNLSKILQLNNADEQQITAKIQGLITEHKQDKDKLQFLIQNQKEEAVLLVDYAIDKQFIDKRYRDFHLAEFDKDFKKARTELIACFKKQVVLAELITDAVVKKSPNINVEIKTTVKAKTEWNLEDYRKRAPQELENNPELFKQLLNEQKNGKFKG